MIPSWFWVAQCFQPHRAQAVLQDRVIPSPAEGAWIPTLPQSTAGSGRGATTGGEGWPAPSLLLYHLV